MQGNHLGAEEVLAVLDAVGDFDLLVAAVVDDRIGSPLAVAEALLLDLEPAVPDTIVFGGVGDLLEVRHNWPLVARVHNVIGTSYRVKLAQPFLS